MAICCSTSAFAPPLESALAEVARLGFTEVDLIAIEGWGHLEPAALVANWERMASVVEALLRRHGLVPVAMNVAVGSLHQRSDDVNAQRLRKVEAVARLMRRLGIGVASFYPGYKAVDRPWEAVLADTVATLRELLLIARAFDVTFCLEPHYDTPFQTPAQVRRLLAALPELRLVYDPSHFAMQGLDLSETAFMLDRAVHVHLRDAAPGAMQVAFGEGTADLPGLLSALRTRGYGGHLSIEYLAGGAFDVAGSVRRLRDAVAALPD